MARGLSSSTAAYGAFRVKLIDVELRDWTWFADARGYFPPVRGALTELRGVKLTSYSFVPPAHKPTLVSEEFVLPSTRNLLAGVVDVSAVTVPAATDSKQSCGGWAVASGGGTFHAVTEGLPVVAAGSKPGPAPAVAALRLSGAAGDVRATSARFAVAPGTTYVVQGHVRSGTAGDLAQAAPQVRVVASFLRFDAKPAAPTPNATVLEAAAGAIGSLGGVPTWEPLLLRVAVPADAAWATLSLRVDAGAVLDVVALGVF